MDTGNPILFQERQYFRKWWIWLILLEINGLFLFGVFKQVIGGESFGDKPMSNTGLLIFTAVMFLFSIVMLTSRLDTIIKSDGIYVRFSPYHIRFKHYPWEDLDKSLIRKYSALLEYGGWGLRFGLKGTAFNVSGNQGLQLVFKSGKKILIGTQKPAEMTTILTAMERLN